MSAPKLRAVELFAGIGGFGVASSAQVEVVAAIDLSSHALSVLSHNAPKTPTLQRSVERLKAETLAAYEADLWWMSPPCQPYTVRGQRRDLEDHRAAGLLHALDLIEACQPPRVALENVDGFYGSEAHARLLQTFERGGYEVWETRLCSSELGVPAKRERYYAIASRAGALDRASSWARWPARPLSSYLEPLEAIEESLYVSLSDQERFARAMRIFERHEPEGSAPLNCFTSAYGKTFRYSGAFLREAPGRVRYFAPRELLALLHFPGGYHLPEGITRRQAYRYIGNSLSLRAVREVLRRLPGLEALGPSP